jgi:UDP-sugar transporter A1/2/3
MLLAAGVALARAPQCHTQDVGSGFEEDVEWSGNALALLSCFLSAFAGIANEYLMKGRSQIHSIHLQNGLLYAYGVLFNFIALAIREPETLLVHGMLHDFSATVYVLVLLNVLCGLCISGVLKYADNMVRANASAGSLLLSMLIESLVLGEPPSVQLLLSTVVVSNSVVLYSISPEPELVAPIIEMVSLSEEGERKLHPEVVE